MIGIIRKKILKKVLEIISENQLRYHLLFHDALERSNACEDEKLRMFELDSVNEYLMKYRALDEIKIDILREFGS